MKMGGFMKEKKKTKLVSKIKGFFYRTKRFVFWYYNYINLHCSHYVVPFINSAINTIKSICVFGFFIVLLNQCNILKFNFLANDVKDFFVFGNLSYTKNSILPDLVIAQVSSAFLTTAVLSLVSSVDKKYILGERTLDLIFKSKSLRFEINFFIIYILMFLNIVFVITEKYATVVITIFIISLFLLIYIINSIGKIFITTKQLEKKLVQKYYLENIKIIDPPHPGNKYRSKFIDNFQIKVSNGISSNDEDYAHNLRVYMDLFRKTLFNKSKQLQEFKIDYGFKNDISNGIVIFCLDLINNNKIYEAIELYYEFLANLNYHKIYYSDYRISDIMKKIVLHLEIISNTQEGIEYIRKVENILSELNLQQFYADSNDFSYMRLANLRFETGSEMLYLNKNTVNLYEQVYASILNNDFSTVNKNELLIQLFESTRMSGHHSKRRMASIDNNSYKWKENPEYELPRYIIGLPLAYMYLRMFINKDKEHLLLFQKMNLDDKEMLYAIHICVMILIMLNGKNMNSHIYNNYREIDFSFVNDFIKENSKILFKEKADYNEFFDFIKNNNVRDDGKLSKLPFCDSYYAEFEDDYINVYFDYINKNLLDNSIKKIKINKKWKAYKVCYSILNETFGTEK